MWIVRWIVLVLIILAVLGFSLQNQDPITGVRLFGWESGQIPLYVALFVAFALGMVAFLLIAVFQQLQTLSELNRVKRHDKRITNERDDLLKEIDALREESEHNEAEKTRLHSELEILHERIVDIEGHKPGTSLPRDVEHPSDPTAGARL